jgi:hypothetical protein
MNAMSHVPSKENSPKNVKRALILTSEFALQKNSGANARLETIHTILKKSGYQPKYIAAKHLKKLKHLEEFYDLGVIVSFANIRNTNALNKVCKYLWLDSVDSVLHTRLLGLGSNRMKSFTKGFFDLKSVIMSESKFVFVTYITELDRHWDRYFFKESEKKIIPNRTVILPEREVQKKPEEFYFVGDLNYNANRKALKFLLRNLANLPTEFCRDLHVVCGTRKISISKLELKNGINVFFEKNLKIEDMYHENAIHLSPIWNSVGMKNKVLEPASLGLRVIGGSPSFNGLKIATNMTTVDKKADFIPLLINMMLVNSPRVAHQFSIIEADESSETIEFLKNLR